MFKGVELQNITSITKVTINPQQRCTITYNNKQEMLQQLYKGYTRYKQTRLKGAKV